MDRRADREGIEGGGIVMAVGALLLFVALFIDWYQLGRSPVAEAVTAWTAFELVDLILALITVIAVASVVEPLTMGTSRIPAVAGAAAGPAALVLVLVSILNKPPAAQGNTDLEVGAWLALAGAAIMCAGVLLAMNRVSLVVTRRDEGSQGSSRPMPARQGPPAPTDRDEERASETRTRRL